MIDIKIITKEQQSINTWTGGTTTQIAIYPYDSSYLDREFSWRLSTATVELEESTFTKLTGFDRHLMVLEGEIKLVHKEQHSVVLKQYEQDHFKGDWDTASFGRARDFNLMVREGLQGKLEHYKVEAGQEFAIEFETESQKQNFFACYCYKEPINIRIENKCYNLAEGDLFLLSCNNKTQAIIDNIGQKESSLIFAYVKI